MARSWDAPCALYAFVPTREAKSALARRLRVRLVRGDEVTAIVGEPPACTLRQAAIGHDRVVGAALEACASVIPFRLGATLPSTAALSSLLRRDQAAIMAALHSVRDRVEMGFKVGLDVQAGSRGMLACGRLPFSLERVHALAPSASDRREKVVRRARGVVFTGCYLIARTGVARFWEAVADIRRRFPALPLLGSGPWAAYSFADLVLRIETPAEARR